MLMRAKTKVDFFVVQEDQRPMDVRLANWARWCSDRPSVGVSPMFRGYRAEIQVRGDCNAGGPAVDGIDAQRVQKGISALPEPHRKALIWFYFDRCNPGRARRELATTMDGLAQYVRDGRRMLINRKI